MGGNALAHAGARRVDKETALGITSQVVAILKDIAAKHSAVFDCRPIPAYFSKSSFGDVDLILDSRFHMSVPRNVLIDELDLAFGCKTPNISNGPVLSFGAPLNGGGCLQVDLISTSQEYVNSAVDYYSWNDTGNLIGRIAHKMGFKYGHKGLSIVLRDGTHKFGEVNLTTDTQECLEFLGYSPIRWRNGFNTIEDIYKFVASSRFFNSALYALENRNHVARLREAKRPIYLGFLEWLKENESINEFKFPESRDSFLGRALVMFPEQMRTYYKKWEELEQVKYTKSRFNATIVSNYTGRTDKALGSFMRHFKYHHNDFLKDIRTLTDGEIQQFILSVEKGLQFDSDSPAP